MSSFIKSLWSRTKKDPEVRRLDHPKDLMTGDLLQMSDSFGLPEQLRNQVFKVVGISTWQFEHTFSTCFSLQSQSDDSVDLTIEEDGGRESAAFSFAISRDVVEQLFDLDEFGAIFEEEPTSLTLQDTTGMEGLVAPQYHQVSSGERGFYYEKDYRDSSPPEHEGSGEALDYYCLVDNEEAFGVEVEVYQGGETDIALTLYRELDVIKDLWPAEIS